MEIINRLEGKGLRVAFHAACWCCGGVGDSHEKVEQSAADLLNTLLADQQAVEKLACVGDSYGKVVQRRDFPRISSGTRDAATATHLERRGATASQ